MGPKILRCDALIVIIFKIGRDHELDSRMLWEGVKEQSKGTTIIRSRVGCATHYLIVDDTYERLKTTFPGDIAALSIAKGLRAEENMESVAPEPVVEEIDGS